MPARKTIALTLAAALVLGGGGTAVALALPSTVTRNADPAAGTASVSYRGLDVTGYADAYATTAKALAKKSKKLTSVGVDGTNFTADGGSYYDVPDEAYALLKQAHRAGDTAELLIGNYDNDLGDFSPDVAAALLDSPANMRATATALAAEVKKHGWDGVQVDLESLSSLVEQDPGYTDRVTGYLALLRAELDAVNPRKTLSIAIMATEGDYRDLGYDPLGIAESTDSIVLMAYDQHGPWENNPGPVGGMPWVKKVLANLLKTVPKNEVQLGIAGYAYSWPKKGAGKQYSAAAARALVKRDGAKTHWSGTQRERYATLRNGTRLWWSDAKAVDERVALARSLKLKGIAVWSIGLADTLD